jgi:hypothetical protein
MFDFHQDELSPQHKEIYTRFADTRTNTERGFLSSIAPDTRDHRMLYHFAHLAAVKYKSQLTTNNPQQIAVGTQNLTHDALALYQDAANTLEKVPEKKTMTEFTITSQLADLATLQSQPPDSYLYQTSLLSFNVRKQTLAEVGTQQDIRLCNNTVNAFKLFIQQLAPAPTGGPPTVSKK